MDFTIAIPTYNGAKRIPDVLDRLKNQVGVEDIAWEVIVVDNNSTDDTAQVVKQYQENWLSGVPFSYCFEPQQGAAFARKRAITESRGDWIGFLDDDVTPDEDWLISASKFLQTRDNLGAFSLGAFSGKIRGVYEVAPPKGFDKIKYFLAIRDHGNHPRRFLPEQLQLPPAASLVIRRSAWLESVPRQQKLTGKRPGLFIQGDDYEPLLYLHKANWEIWYTPDLGVSHHIPASRFDRDYLLTLAKGCGLATFQLRVILSNSVLETAFLCLRTLAGNGRRLIWHGLKYRNRIRDELVPGFFWMFYYGSFLSPFVKSKVSDSIENSHERKDKMD